MDQQNTPNTNTQQLKPVKEEVQPRQQKKKLYFAVGLVVIVLVLALGTFLLIRVMQPSTPQTTSQPTQQEIIEQIPLTLDSPSEGALAIEDEILVKGKTLPNATVAIFTESDEVLVVSDLDGLFETTIKLIPGINSLNITAFSEKGDEKSLSINIVYDDET